MHLKALAEELFSEVIDYSFANNKYWASTADEWIKIWISDNDNKYHIFEIQYIAAKNYGNPMVFNSVPAVNDSYTKIQMSGNRIWCENNWTVFSSKPTKLVLSLTNVVQELSIQVNLSTKTELLIQEGISS